MSSLTNSTRSLCRRFFQFTNRRTFCVFAPVVLNPPVTTTRTIWTCERGLEKLLAEEMATNTKSPVDIKTDEGFIEITHPSDVVTFTDPVWATTCLYNYFGPINESNHQEIGKKYVTETLSNMFSETVDFATWYLAKFEFFIFLLF